MHNEPCPVTTSSGLRARLVLVHEDCSERCFVRLATGRSSVRMVPSDCAHIVPAERSSAVSSSHSVDSSLDV